MAAIKVYVVDDSAVVRQTIAHLLSGCADIDMMGSAPNPLIAINAIRKNRPIAGQHVIGSCCHVSGIPLMRFNAR